MNCNEIPLFVRQENVTIFIRPWPNCNVTKKSVEKIGNCCDFFRPWPIVMFQK